MHLKAPSLVRMTLALAAACLMLIIVFRSLSASVNIPINHIDGTFQISSGLYHLDAGLCPGRDFLPYLGVGLLYLLYPIFKLAGANVFAAMFASQAITLLSSVFSLLTICLLCLRGRLLISVCITSILLSICLLDSPFDIPGFIFDRLQPGQSLRPIRSVAPYLSFFCAYLMFRKRPERRIGALALGAIAGLCILWSNDFGMPSLFALCGFMISLWLLDQVPGRSLVLFSLSLCAAATVGLVISTCGSPGKLLSYNFLDVAKDQWWYFGPWSDESRIFSLADLHKLFAKKYYDFALASLLSGLIFLLAFATKRFEHITLAWLTAALLLGTLVVTIGGHIEPGYLNPIVFHAFLVGLLLPLGYLMESPLNTGPAIGPDRTSGFVSCALLLVLICVASIEKVNYQDEINSAQIDINRFYVAELGGYLPISWKNYVEKAKFAKGAMIEEYWGIWSAIQGNKNVFPVDSVIHALGNTREIAKELLIRTPAVQITSTRLGFSVWQPWSMSSNWWLYRHLILNYTPQRGSSATVVWSRSNQAIVPRAVDCEIHEGQVSFMAPQPGLYEVSVELANARPRGRHLLLVRNGLVHAMRSEGLLSLPIDGQSKTFPFLAFEKGFQPVDFLYRGVRNLQRPEVSRCIVSFIDFSHPDVFRLPSPHPTTADLTTKEWLRGVARYQSKILVIDTPQNQERFTVGKTIIFADGSRRQIIDSVKAAPYLEISYSGLQLESAIIGAPNPIASE